MSEALSGCAVRAEIQKEKMERRLAQRREPWKQRYRRYLLQSERRVVGKERRTTKRVTHAPEPEPIDPVNHPPHYGGKDNPCECIKVIDAWGLGFNLGNTLKYISRAGRKDEPRLLDLRKAAWYLQYEINTLAAKLKEEEDAKQ